MHHQKRAWWILFRISLFNVLYSQPVWPGGGELEEWTIKLSLWDYHYGWSYNVIRLTKTTEKFENINYIQVSQNMLQSIKVMMAICIWFIFAIQITFDITQFWSILSDFVEFLQDWWPISHIKSLHIVCLNVIQFFFIFRAHLY